MNNIVKFPLESKTLSTECITKQEKSVYNIDRGVEKLLSQTPEDINNIINSSYTSPNDIITISESALRNLIFDYIIFKLKSGNIKVYGSVIMGSSYITDLLFRIFLCKDEEIKDIIDNPYYTDWVNKGFYKKAGDASVFSYLFRSFYGKPIKADNYINFAMAGYFLHNRDKYFAQSVGIILPEIKGINTDKDLLSRGIVREL